MRLQYTTDKEILNFVHNPNDFIYVDFDDESNNGIYDAVLVHCTSEIYKMIKWMLIYLGTLSNREINKTMGNFENLKTIWTIWPEKKTLKYKYMYI